MSFKILSIFVLLQITLSFFIKPTLTPYNLAHSKETSYYASLAYCPRQCLQPWKCGSASSVPKLEQVSYLTDTLTQADGYIGYAPTLNKIIISFRGSSNIQNWIQNANFQKAPYIYCLKCEIHAGFYADYLALSTSINNRVQNFLNKYPNASILTTGHSLGGALAIISATELHRIFKTPSFQVHTFGAPRVGNKQLSKHMNNKISDIYRVVHNKDIVPHLPPDLPKFQYHHSAYEVFFNQDFTTMKICSQTGQDRSCSNQFFPQYSIDDHHDYFIKIGSPKC